MTVRVTSDRRPIRTFAPRDYPCHICGAQPGHKCVLFNGAKREWSHNGRGPNNPPKEANRD